MYTYNYTRIFSRATRNDKGPAVDMTTEVQRQLYDWAKTSVSAAGFGIQ